MTIQNSPAIQDLLDRQAAALVADIRWQIEDLDPRDFVRWLSARTYYDARKVANLARAEREGKAAEDITGISAAIRDVLGEKTKVRVMSNDIINLHGLVTKLDMTTAMTAITSMGWVTVDSWLAAEGMSWLPEGVRSVSLKVKPAPAKTPAKTPTNTCSCTHCQPYRAACHAPWCGGHHCKGTCMWMAKASETAKKEQK
jgi:hypothetical protein